MQTETPDRTDGAVRHIGLETAGSTNAEALARARAGERGPLWITAKAQTAGRGRGGRTWVSPPGNLYATLLLTEPCEIGHAPQLAFVAGVAAHEGQLAGRLVRLQHAEVGDHLHRAAPGEPEPLAGARAVAVPDGRDEVEPLDERPQALLDHDDHLAARRGDLRGAAGARQADLRVPVVADDSRVDVAVAIDLRPTQKAYLDAPVLQQRLKDVGHAAHHQRAGDQRRIAD